MRLNTRLTTVGLVALIATATPAMAATVNVDLSGAVSGATVNGVGASFAQGFSFGPLARVVSPAALARDLREEFARASARYA